MIIPVFVTVSQATCERSINPSYFLDEIDYWMDCSANLPLRQDPASDERPGLRQTLGRTSCLRSFLVNFFKRYSGDLFWGL